MERKTSEFAPKPRGSVVERVKNHLKKTFRPASSASEEAFKSIIAVLPPGDMKKSMEMVLPQLKHTLKMQDRSLVMSSLFQRGISSVVFGVFGAVGGSVAGTAMGLVTANPAIPVYAFATGVGLGVSAAFAIPTASQMERSRIAVAAKQQEMMLRTSGGKEAAKVFDAKRVDQITQAILWGTAANGGAGGVLSQAANPMA